MERADAGRARAGERRVLRYALYAILGVITGALSAAGIMAVPLGNLPGVGDAGQFYLYPGLIFGIAYGILFWAEGRLKPLSAFGFAMAATVSNAIAFTAWDMSDKPIAALLGAEDIGNVTLAITGVIAGAVGGFLLGVCATRLLGGAGWLRLVAAGAVLGLFLPLALQAQMGFYLFYIIWQAGFAATIATIQPRRE